MKPKFIRQNVSQSFCIRKMVLMKSIFFVSTVLLVLLSTACSQETIPVDQAPNLTPKFDSQLDSILKRKKLICGIDGDLPGISFKEQDRYTGLDIDICRAIAAALFDDPNVVEYTELDSTRRFAALTQNQIDVLSRNTTWTLQRDGAVGMAFAPTTFYDGQAVMVRKDAGITTWADLANKSICVEVGTTTEHNLRDKMRELNAPHNNPVELSSTEDTYELYEAGRCNGLTSDRSQLISLKSRLENPEEHIILDEQISKEPLGPAVADGDSQWFDIVQWVIFALIQAEELGITQANLEQWENSENPAIRRFLGKEGELGAGLGISNDFAKRVIKHVGNYGEIYDRNLGAKSQFQEPRGLNALWKDGGLLYSPPFR
ncbi:MAG: amino acid ABC transporter substrate-binding protein [Cyanobacteria bacterium P01_E01_bin.42]